jgi:hypothetical protein
VREPGSWRRPDLDETGEVARPRLVDMAFDELERIALHPGIFSEQVFACRFIPLRLRRRGMRTCSSEAGYPFLWPAPVDSAIVTPLL